MHSTVRNTWLIAKRDYLERVRTKAFLVMTLLTPALVFMWAVVPSMLITSKTGGSRHLVVVTSDPEIGNAIKAGLESQSTPRPKVATRQAAPTSSDMRYTVDVDANVSDSERDALRARIDRREIDGFLWADDESLKAHDINYTARQTNDFIELGTLRSVVRDALLRQELKARGIAAGDVESALKSYKLQTTQWANGKAKKSSEDLQFFTVFILGFAMYITIMIYGIGVMRAILQEKTSRIMEVLMSSVTSTELMAGKIVGVGAVGLTQVAIWAVMASLGASPGAFSIASQIKAANLSAMTAVYFAIFFLLGYVLYSSMCAALGAAVSSEQEAQQIQMFVLMPLILSFLVMFLALRVPDDPRVVALSIFPFTAPLVMYTRIVVQMPPLWQVALSISVTVATIFGVLFICGRIYRVGILMYGKRATLPEIVKWIRYA
jgi:ABC-2 type transport system permease protein